MIMHRHHRFLFVAIEFLLLRTTSAARGLAECAGWR